MNSYGIPSLSPKHLGNNNFLCMSSKTATDQDADPGESVIDGKSLGVKLLANVLTELLPLEQPFLIFSGSWPLL